MAQPTFFRLYIRQFWPFCTSICLLISLGLLVPGMYLLRKEQRYRYESARATGHVIDKYTRSGGKGSRSYRIAYQFKTEDGGTFQGDSRVTRSTWDALSAGDRVAVDYIRTEPETNRIAGASNLTAAVVISALGGLSAPVAIFYFRRSMQRLFASLALWRDGARAEGSVAAIEQTMVSINKVRQWVVEYEFRDHMGQVRHAKSDYMPPEEASAWKVGDRGAVRYDFRDPESSVWVGRDEPV